MQCIVKKFGGTSVANVELIKKAAQRVKEEVDLGYSVVVVVSAMAGTTDRLLEHIRDLTQTYDRSEYDVILSSGEQVTAGLLTLALQTLGISAKSWLGWQLPIKTTTQYGQAEITSINVKPIKSQLSKGGVAVIAGFQGICAKGRVTTLGRGGSDATAVALAASLGAERCDIYTDIDGIYTADPRLLSSAGKLEHIPYQEMIELASQGAKVLQRESVELAMKNKVRLRVLSSLVDAPGTLVTTESELIHKKRKDISGLAHSLSDVLLTLTKIPLSPLSTLSLREALESANIVMDMPQRNLSSCGSCFDFSFTVPKIELERTIKCVEKVRNQVSFYDLLIDSSVAKISVIGYGLIEGYSSSQKLFSQLREGGIRVKSVSASDIKLCVLIESQEAERALSILHSIYSLGAKEKR